ncbi:hypothetical protein G6011_06915 [Alternaria panax]|uniref:Uncharacterized protein n=1 Tax=Alternaria panax TaxID=48097 RepID=A0AAD4FDM7_9PLEO|nr:hypothetical protein G6011_06915 [Alternaria panax]
MSADPPKRYIREMRSGDQVAIAYTKGGERVWLSYRTIKTAVATAMRPYFYTDGKRKVAFRHIGLPTLAEGLQRDYGDITDRNFEENGEVFCYAQLGKEMPEKTTATKSKTKHARNEPKKTAATKAKPEPGLGEPTRRLAEVKVCKAGKQLTSDEIKSAFAKYRDDDADFGERDLINITNAATAKHNGEARTKAMLLEERFHTKTTGSIPGSTVIWLRGW